MSKQGRHYRNYLKKELRSKREALNYLKACSEDVDPRVFLLAIKDVIDAREITMAGLARQSGLGRESLHRMLSMKGNPSWLNINKVLAALGFNFTVELKKAS